VKTLDPTSLILAKAIMGKGSGRRPTDENKFQSNYDLIFGKKPPEGQENNKEKQDGNNDTTRNEEQ
jgi:hypothetical protein